MDWDCSVTKRSPSSREISARSSAFVLPGRITFAVAESQMAPAVSFPHRSRAWASDWSATIVGMPEPPPSDMRDPREGSG